MGRKSKLMRGFTRALVQKFNLTEAKKQESDTFSKIPLLGDLTDSKAATAVNRTEQSSPRKQTESTQDLESPEAQVFTRDKL